MNLIILILSNLREQECVFQWRSSDGELVEMIEIPEQPLVCSLSSFILNLHQHQEMATHYSLAL